MIGAIPGYNGMVAQIIPAYLYEQYNTDENAAAFFTAYNQLAQEYLNWFNQVELPVWTSALIVGPLLDWIGQGIYGYPRPVFTTSSIRSVGPVATFAMATNPVAANTVTRSGTSQLATDDYYKRCLTWALYKGDGQQFTMPWLKRRVYRFLYGPNGSDPGVQTTNPVSITVSGATFTITVPTIPAAIILQEAIDNNVLPLPFQYDFVFNVADVAYLDENFYLNVSTLT